jgi:alpha-1,2-mannosyltransferase
VLPIVACLPPLWGALARGQVNLLLVALLCGMAAAALRGRRAQAGLWLAGAICLKVFPAYLLIYPLWRRDGRCLGGCAAGLVVGLGLIPAAVFGPNQTWAYYREWTAVLVRPGLGRGEDHTRDKELISTTATDSQSFLCVLHNTLHLDRMTRPREAAPETRLAHWILGGALTGLTLLALGWRRPSGRRELLGLGTLTLIMFLLSPVCHLHYFCLALPLTMGFLAIAWESPAREGAGAIWRSLWLWLVLGVNTVANTLPHLPGSDLLRDLGLATYGTLLLWLAGVVILCRKSQTDVGGGPVGQCVPGGDAAQVAA